MKNIVGCRAIVSNIHDGLGTKENDIKFMSKAEGKEVEITGVSKKSDKLFITDFYQEEFSELDSDYIKYGYLLVTVGNITLL